MSNNKSVVAAQPKAPVVKAKAKVIPPAPKADAKAAEGTPKAAKAPAKPKAPSINIGQKSGMRVMAYQDHTFEINGNSNRRLTNEELAADWRAEFPNSRAVKAGRITAEMVEAVRHLYNRGTGGHGTPGVQHESVAFEIVNGKRLPVAVRERKAPEPKAEAKVEPKTATTKAATKPPVPTQPATKTAKTAAA